MLHGCIHVLLFGGTRLGALAPFHAAGYRPHPRVGHESTGGSLQGSLGHGELALGRGVLGCSPSRRYRTTTVSGSSVGGAANHSIGLEEQRPCAQACAGIISSRESSEGGGCYCTVEDIEADTCGPLRVASSCPEHIGREAPTQVIGGVLAAPSGALHGLSR